MHISKLIFLTILTTVLMAFAFQKFPKQQDKEPWTQHQLMDPADLARILNDSESIKPIVYNIGPQAIIKNSIDIGPTHEKENLKELRKQFDNLSRKANVVIYCGCCPFNQCPNIRPAFLLLNEMQFKNHKLLNLPHNIKVDWIDRGFPVNN